MLSALIELNIFAGKYFLMVGNCLQEVMHVDMKIHVYRVV